MSDRLPLVFILTTLVIDSMGIGLMIPVMPTLIREVNGGTIGEAAIWGGILTTSFAVMQFLFGPLLGGLSDRFGRRPVLFVSLGVMTLDYLVMAVAGSIWLLLAARLVGGVTAATQSVGYAFVADISRPEEKAARFGLVSAAFGAGFVLGPIIGGLLAEWGTRAPFFAAAALSGMNLILGILVLPETVTDRIRRPFQWSRANPLGAFAALRTYPNIARLVLLFLIYQVAFHVYPAIWAFFTEARFGWDTRLIGISLTAFGTALAIVQAMMIPRLLKLLGETGTIRFGLAFNAVAFLTIGLVSNGTLAMILTPLTALGAVVTPAIMGIMSRTVGNDVQGELQGLLTSAGSLAMILSPLLMTTVFATFTGPAAPLDLPGAPFLLSMSLMGVCAIIFSGRRPATAS